MEKENNKSITINLIWHFMEKWLCQIMSFIITIVIARILDPKVYAPVAIVNVFTSIFSVFIDAGLGSSLIQKKDADSLDYSTVFVANIILCLSIYLLLFFGAPLIANYYQLSSLTSLIRVASITLLIAGLKNIQYAYIAKNMIFKKFFFASLAGTIGSGIIGIYLALKGFGAWALVISSLFDISIDTICIWLFIDFRPKIAFSYSRFKPLFNYSWKILVTALIDRIYNKMYHLVIGKKYSSEDLAYYDKGNSLISKITDNTTSIIDSVVGPAMCNKQDDKKELKDLVKKTIKVNTYILAPLLIGIFVISDSLIEVVLTKKWMFAVPYVRFFSLINITLPLIIANTNALKALGKSDIILKQEIIKKIVGIIILIFTLNISTMAIVEGRLLLSIIYVIIVSSKNKELLDYGLFEQLCDIGKTMIICIIMGTIVYSVSLLIPTNGILLLIMQIICGIVVYILLSLIFKSKEFYFLLNKVKYHQRKLLKKKIINRC